MMRWVKRCVFWLVAACAVSGAISVTNVRQADEARSASNCTRPAAVTPVRFDAAKYPNMRRHTNAAIRRGEPKVLVVNREGADRRRQRLMASVRESMPARDGLSRDEYAPAVGRRTWRADLAYVPARENASHGASLGNQLRGLCDGARFRYVFR